MRKYYYDLHLHSCLSPCADQDMTPNNIAGMAALAGLELVALTDHNSTKNCPAFFAACERVGIIPVAGMELTTAEDIHLVCLFETLGAAAAFDEAVAVRRILIPNRTDIFGEQLILDEQDRVIGSEEFLLSNATALSLEEAVELVRRFGGAAYPAHIDREANGIIAVLGTLPETPVFAAAEFHDAGRIGEYRERYPVPEQTPVCSDAHYLTDIPDAAHRLALEGENPAEVRRSLIGLLGGSQRGKEPDTG